jgi:prolyl-tRNA synthetase
LGPTHEEVITDLVRREIHSYRQLPLNFYQIQTKFRDEIRPRFGLMRCREFIMKDAYSFDADEAGADRSYEKMYEAYDNIFRRCGLKFRAVEADTGSIGGSFSHEFMVLADTGEDQIVNCLQCDYAANLEKAEVTWDSHRPASDYDEEMMPLEEVETPDKKTVEEVTSFLSISPDELIKTLILRSDSDVIAALVRGDHELNEVKLKNLLSIEQVELADPQLVAEVTGGPMGFTGPPGLKLKMVADHAIKGMRNFVVGGNKKDLHLRNVNMERDFHVDIFGDIRAIKPDDSCPRCGMGIRFRRGIEVGHIFKLGTKYSKAMGAVFLDRHGKEEPLVMGCYGIGLGRTVGAAIEQYHDKDGIIFPIPIAPFEVVILALQIHETKVIEAAEKIYRELADSGMDVLLDERDVSPGSKFKDADLLGIPVTLGEISAIAMKKVDELYDSIN